MKNPLLRTMRQAAPFCLALFLAVCARSALPAESSEEGQDFEPFILQVEDILQVSFPGAPELDAQIQVRRDGVISVPIIGEVRVAGLTPSQLENFLEKRLESELVSNDVLVVVLQSQFTYYLEGEVLQPGVVQSFRKLSVLEAIIAAGGIDKNSGKLDSVVVIRRVGARYDRFELNLKAVINGRDDSAFVLESYDIVSVPERVW